MIKLHNADCLEAMRLMEDDSFELAIVDPPYGIGMDGGKIGSFAIAKGQKTRHEKKNWDNSIPDPEYFQELKRVSKNQIIWGGNYFLDYLSNTRCMIVWDKNNGGNSMADCELAWTSFDSSVRKFTYSHIEDHNKKILRIHPTQKPAALYTWLLEKYAKPNDRILDTHLGSGSIAIACHNLGYDLTGYELDKDYYQAAQKRLKNHQKQLRMF
jgi:site-specific DNA-methyltransferase (adenine-specific)